MDVGASGATVIVGGEQGDDVFARCETVGDQVAARAEVAVDTRIPLQFVLGTRPVRGIRRTRQFEMARFCIRRLDPGVG